MTWIARERNGRRNALGGYVSTELSAKRIIEDLFDHYSENCQNKQMISEFLADCINDCKKDRNDRTLIKSMKPTEFVKTFK
jgi:hypothetical protein